MLQGVPTSTILEHVGMHLEKQILPLAMEGFVAIRQIL